jgi:NAD(P)-dependent dehydrogenase (short-subunit alcohol dehydrogenase family)
MRWRVFEGRTAVITRGGTGVGEAVALALAKAGASVHLIGRRLEKLQSIAAKAHSLGSQATCYSCNLATDSGQLELAQRLIRDLPHVDVLVQSAVAADLIDTPASPILTDNTKRTSGLPTS